MRKRKREKERKREREKERKREREKERKREREKERKREREKERKKGMLFSMKGHTCKTRLEKQVRVIQIDGEGGNNNCNNNKN
jgi:hypothetical protein